MFNSVIKGIIRRHYLAGNIPQKQASEGVKVTSERLSAMDKSYQDHSKALAWAFATSVAWILFSLCYSCNN